LCVEEVRVPCRILIADDHSVMRKAIKSALEAHAGWEVCAEAVNGLQAVQKAAELKPDVIILDLSMPVMGGLEAAPKILSVLPGLPIVLFTNHMYSGLVEEAQKVGIRRVVSKQGDGLVSTVEAILDEKLMSALDVIQAETISEQVKPPSSAEKK
jgi:DNA-binding NarL/FixJ family response regulator